MAAQEASAHCSSAAIPGTSSSLLAPMEALMAAAASQQQQRQQQQRSYHQDSRQQQQQQQDRWQSQLQGNGSSSRRSSSGGSNGGEGSSGVLEAAVLSSFKGLELHRRLASFRLHRCVVPICQTVLPACSSSAIVALKRLVWPMCRIEFFICDACAVLYCRHTGQSGARLTAHPQHPSLCCGARGVWTCGCLQCWQH